MAPRCGVVRLVARLATSPGRCIAILDYKGVCVVLDPRRRLGVFDVDL